MNHTVDFYTQGTGDALVDPDNYPDAIRQYLREERHLLQRHCKAFDTLIEAGCTAGHYADLAISAGKEYVGIDIAHQQDSRGEDVL